MIRMIFLFAVLGIGLFIGTQFAGQQGYVLISIADKTVEMSVTTLVVFIIALLAALFFTEFVIKKTLHASATTWNWFSVRKVKRARRYTNEGIVKLLEGDWQAAEKKVTRWANHHDMPLLCYLIASEAAQEMGNDQKRDHYLALADKQDNSKLAVQLTKARQQIREKQYQLAYESLSELKVSNPDNPMVLALLKTAYVNLKMWQPLLEILPKLAKSKNIDAQQQVQLFKQAQSGMLIDVAHEKGSEGLLAHWNKLPKKVRQDGDLIVCLVEQLMAREADNEAFTVIKEAIKKKTATQELIALIPELNISDEHPSVVMLEGVIKKDPENAAAHSALGQLLIRSEKWQQAQQHLETALSVRANVTDYAYLADALEKQDLTHAANDVSKQALKLVEAR
ncbi:heme biosynthesis protein HemY [Vibrio sp. SCSIO 43137]|uniref:heme biosynthesis protein HemY n=1 Tax=Vibrio sp. SCSIO 43137 TaxID=3021011 RepID=UPI002307F77C|nr:heme biosynthesis HemY N-terminal domain-containing protein [Vibrio sp. SCSIO 43137]WCE29638.1 heme biosynthesis HemY N-terminal domain-containing protein [Vibrio sp. SCSIO 43137]